MKKRMSIGDYHADKSISKSKLDLLNKSILHYLEPPEYKSKSMDIGSALHDAVLLPDLFDKTYTKQPPEIKQKRGKKWDEFFAKHGGKTIMTVSDYDKIMRMRDRIYSHPIGKNMFKNGEPEMSYFNNMDIYGQEFDVKCRPDYLGDGFAFDLKTTRDASQYGFRNAITNYRYNVQAAWYMDILNKEPDLEIKEFIFIAIETEPPFPIGIYYIDQESIDCGRDDYRENLLTLVKYNENKYVPTGYTDDGVEKIGCNEFYFYKKIKGV